MSLDCCNDSSSLCCYQANKRIEPKPKQQASRNTTPTTTTTTTTNTTTNSTAYRNMNPNRKVWPNNGYGHRNESHVQVGGYPHQSFGKKARRLARKQYQQLLQQQQHQEQQQEQQQQRQKKKRFNDNSTMTDLNDIRNTPPPFTIANVEKYLNDLDQQHIAAAGSHRSNYGHNSLCYTQMNVSQKKDINDDDDDHDHNHDHEHDHDIASISSVKSFEGVSFPHDGQEVGSAFYDSHSAKERANQLEHELNAKEMEVKQLQRRVAELTEDKQVLKDAIKALALSLQI